MIVREILEDPFKVVAIFDWFNDYKDTRSYLIRVIGRGDDRAPKAMAVLKLLDAGYQLYRILP